MLFIRSTPKWKPSWSVTMCWSRFASELISLLKNLISFKISIICYTSKKVNKKRPIRCQKYPRHRQWPHWALPLSTSIWSRTRVTSAITKWHCWIWTVLCIWMGRLCLHWICCPSQARPSIRKPIAGKAFWVFWIDAARHKDIVWWHSGCDSRCEMKILYESAMKSYNASWMPVRPVPNWPRSIWNGFQIFWYVYIYSIRTWYEVSSMSKADPIRKNFN